MPQFEKAFNGRFTLFPSREKKSERSPDKTGFMELELEEALKLADWITAQPGETNYKGDKIVKIPMAAWDKRSTKNPNLQFISGFISANASPPTTNTVY